MHCTTGYLIEGALAHQEGYANDFLPQTVVKYVDLLCKTFGRGSDQKTAILVIQSLSSRYFAASEERKTLGIGPWLNIS
ncbi:hypothetical protein L207DRAFT_581790 [Hyaloscypha variabilis F]|uniref:Uncharacterized protein n=1 Tax=Hyaloscypha variabilis (strain UAMH 11265 / GT02V1 / F) TaxID=1149755 RepID=A0A2J6RS80_HYAVF|nr:hypothetical protein L207DRAFT_581790 [Hyaloscypha variabilis F]